MENLAKGFNVELEGFLNSTFRYLKLIIFGILSIVVGIWLIDQRSITTNTRSTEILIYGSLLMGVGLTVVATASAWYARYTSSHVQMRSLTAFGRIINFVITASIFTATVNWFYQATLLN